MSDNTIFLINRALKDGLCPVCHKKPCGVWPDGTPHITCGDNYCFYMWLTRQPPMETDEWRALRSQRMGFT